MGAGGKAGNGGEPFSDSLWRGVSIGQWDAERLDGKARAILSTSGLVLTVMAIGLIGFAEVFGTDTESLAALDRLFLGNLAPLLLFGALGLSGVVASVLCSMLALQGIRGGSVSDYRALAGPDGAATGRRDEAMGERQHSPRDAYVRRLDALSRGNRRAAKYIRLGQVYMSYGLASIFVISVTVIIGTIYALELSEISAAASAAQMCLDTGGRDGEPSMWAKLWAESNPPLAEWPGAHAGPRTRG